MAAHACVLALISASAACDIEWGGAQLSLVDPSPPPEPADTAAGPAPIPEVPLPSGPLLYAVRPDSAGETALVLPIARWDADSLVTLALPDEPDKAYSERFGAAFLSPGTELHLQWLGRRVGSVVLGGPRGVADEACPPIATGSLLLIPGESIPSLVFALPPGIGPTAPERSASAALDDRIRTFGPILAEAILRESGEPRPFLAQRADLVAVPWAGDARPAMAATYLINDQAGGPPPAGEAVSLFFLARFDPARGYVPTWSEVRRYAAAESREFYTWADALSGAASSRIDVLRRHGSAGVLLAASRDRHPEDRRIDWTEPSRCSVERLLMAEPEL